MKYTKFTQEALNRIEQKWKGLEDTDRTAIGDEIETAIAEAVAAARAAEASDLDTIRKILAKS